MAKLVGEQGLSLEVRYAGPRHGWMEYEVSFLWRGVSILNRAALKCDTVMANQCLDGPWDKSDLAQVIGEVLETGKPGKWEPLEPDVEVAVCQLHADLFVLTISVDTRAFEGCDSYTGDTVSLKMHVTRQSLDNFVQGLRCESARTSKGARNGSEARYS